MGTNGHKSSGRPIDDTWQAYWNSGKTCQNLRNKLIEHYFPTVKGVAQKIHKKLPDEVDLDDLVSAGVFGLMDSIEGFEPERGYKFETYCAPRIRGAILDSIRELDWVPRLTRLRTRQLGSVKSRLIAKLGREPTLEEIREELGVDATEFDKIIGDSNVVTTSSLFRKHFDNEARTVYQVDLIADENVEFSDQVVENSDLRREITAGLRRVQKIIVELYYFEGYTMKEIADFLFMSESRVSQMHDQTIQQIRAKDNLRNIYWNNRCR